MHNQTSHSQTIPVVPVLMGLTVKGLSEAVGQDSVPALETKVRGNYNA
jgi:hypothetical protein